MKGDGTALAHEDKAFNALVDHNAKLAVAEHRTPEGIRERAKQMTEDVLSVAGWVGQAMFAANNQTCLPHRDTSATRQFKTRPDKPKTATLPARPRQPCGLRYSSNRE